MEHKRWNSRLHLPFSSACKEFYEHMTGGRHLLKCKPEEISDNVFVLGVMMPAAFNAALADFIENKIGGKVSVKYLSH